MDTVLAIDTGGTKCDAILVAADGTVCGWGHSEPREQGGRSREAMRQAVDAALTIREFDRLVLSTVSTIVPTSIIGSASSRVLELAPSSEENSAFNLAGVDYGLAVLAGTGAFVAAIDAKGRRRKFDGMGPLMGDDGSGYQIGREALRAVMRTNYHPRHRTMLRAMVLNEAGVPSPMSLLSVFGDNHNRALVASYARLVDAAARKGDTIADEILQNAADNQARNVMDMLDIMKMRQETFPMIGWGSVITGSDLYWGYLCDRVRAVTPGIQPTRVFDKPVLGMAISGLNYLHHDDADAAFAARQQLMISAEQTPFRITEADAEASRDDTKPNAQEPTP